MLREWYTYLRASCPPEARQLGYLHEAIAIRERHARNREAWEPHLRDSQNFILRSLMKCPSHRECIVLGSGLLLDVPLSELAQKFERVHLVDIVHLPEIRRTVRTLDNVELIEIDVTGIVRPLANRSPADNPLPPPAPPRDLPRADLVLSLNLLSQLPLALISAACSGRVVPSAALAEWIRDIQQSHWDWLRSLAPTRCVITDQRHLVCDRRGAPLREETMVSLDQLPPPNESWTWQLAPAGEINRHERVDAQVCAWIMND